MARRPPTEAQNAERAEQLEHLHAQIADKVADLTSSEQWQAWLHVASRFHQYSFNNTILIWTQRPDATLVVPLLETFDRRVPDGIRQATDEEILSRLGGVWECPEVILCGHSHRPALRWLAGGTVVMNPGSVGLPAYWDDDPHPYRVATGDVRARCGLLQHSAASNTVWTTTLLALPYDHDAASRLAAANGGAEAALAIRTGSVPMPPPE